MLLKKLTLINFRNYPELSISFPPDGALLEGLNGMGKTNLLEAVHVLCTGRSQRGAARADMIAYGEESAFVEGEFCPTPASAHTTVSFGFSRDKKIIMKRDGVEAGSFSEWFGERPAVSFGTDDLELVRGAPETRRRFIDMLICQMDRVYFNALMSYRKNMACRNALFGRTAEVAQFEVYERAMASAAAVLVSRRAEITNEIALLTSNFYADISGGKETVAVEYACRCGSQPATKKIEAGCDPNASSEWSGAYLKTLADRRVRDAELMFTAHGPHRDDLRFLFDGRPAKSYASQGQSRSFALSLKLASVALLERNKGDGMIFLVDDAVSELDHERTSRVYPLLEGRGQIFIATPRCHATLGGGIMRYKVERGKISCA